MTKREMKYECYKDLLEKNMVSVEMILNQLKKLEGKQGIIDQDILMKDQIETKLNLELSLATLCILLRKMTENQFIQLSQELRRDLNSIIHSNRFEFDDELIVYSQKGREEVNLDEILSFCQTVLLNDNVLL